MDIRYLALAGLLALAHDALAQHSGHGHGAAEDKKAPPANPDTKPDPKSAARPEAKADARKATEAPKTSAFADYIPFNPQEPMKPWRLANEEVQQAGGHVGLMKGERGAAEAHPGHKK